MEGPADIVDFIANKDNPKLGMIPRSVCQIFSTIQDLQPKGWKVNRISNNFYIFLNCISFLYNLRNITTFFFFPLKEKEKKMSCAISEGFV